MSSFKISRTLHGVFLLLFMGVVTACQKENKIEKEIAGIPVQFQVERFDKIFTASQPSDLPRLKQEYPQFFPAQYDDSVWVKMMTDSVYVELNQEVEKIYPDFDGPKEELTGLFQHLKYYYPDFIPPRVYTVISEVDYDNRVILADSVLLIGIDNYLGSQHRFYRGIQRYLSKNFKQEQIAPDVAQEYGKQQIVKPDKRALVDFMIYYGKILYFKQLMLPHTPPASIMGYTEEEWEWAESNERQIWGYFLESQILFDTEYDLRRRFLQEGPFTRFGLELDNESPAKLGQYLGWKIVNRYAKTEKNISLRELLNTDNRTLFEKANYKPKNN